MNPFFELKAREPAKLQPEVQRHKTKVYIALGIFSALFVLAWLALRFSPYPELEAFAARPCSVRYYDRNGILMQITPLADGLRRERADAIPDELKEIFVFAEDRRFYRHGGVDVLAFFRAFFQNAAGGRRVSGASTITMQLARLIAIEDSPTRRDGMSRKMGEALNALRLEARLSKNDILDLYLNSLPFGFNAEGLASAARTFFASDLAMLSPSQMFALAVIPRRPSLYNPLENADACIAAARELQSRFIDNKKRTQAHPLLADISDADWQYAANSARRFIYPFELPHLIRHIGSVTANAYLFARSEMRLSIDLALQRHIEGAIAGNVERHYASRLTNGAAIVIDNETGEILAWVGSAAFTNTAAAGQVDGVLALHQPGSSMKPFLYAMALENGFLPTDVIADVPMSFGESEVYLPRNFNNRFNGPMLFRASLASSLNIPAVYLLYRLSVHNYTQRLLSLGFNSLELSAEDAGLGLALGNAPVSLEELVRAFSVFPRDGVYLPLTWELGAIHGSARRVYLADTARLINAFLSDPGARVLAFGSAANFRTPFPAIFKTGTANQFQSIVALGASPRYSAGVWMGNFTGETVIGRTGSSIPAAIARDALVFVQEKNSSVGEAARTFPLPDAWHLRRICALSGMAPTDACLAVIDEYLQHDAEHQSCTWHQMVNGRSEVVYPGEYQSWFTATAREGSLDHGSRPLEIINLREGFEYLSSPGIGRDEIPVEVIGGSENELRVTHNGRVFTVSRPFVFYLERTPGPHTLHIQCGDEDVAITFTVR